MVGRAAPGAAQAPETAEAPEPPPAPAPPVPPMPRRPGWEAGYRLLQVAADAVLLVLAWVAALALEDRAEGALWHTDSPLHALPAGLFVPPWLALIALSRGYDARCLGGGSDEMRRLINASVAFTALVGTTAFLSDADLSRSFVATALPLGLALLLVGRCVARAVVHALRRRGRVQHRCVVVGTEDEVRELASRIVRDPTSSMHVVGVCLPDRTTGVLDVAGTAVPVVGPTSQLAEVLAPLGADTVAVAGGGALTSAQLRRLSWQLEGRGVDLALAPGLTDVAGPRIHMRPVAGLPLLHVEEPTFGGARGVVKSGLDLVLALLLLTLLAPVMIAIAVMVRREDGGPVFYRQERVGREGKVFRIWKFRSMVVGADQRQEALLHVNEHAGPLFKIREDPRLTRTGRRIRRLSLDELPQLLNVVLGSMSLVGPRPPLPSEVEQYDDHVHRRLLVKPGMTGLWQISGRSDLGWDEGVRLDLYYVENWSVASDLLILWKTLFAVLRGRGAY